MAEQIGPDFRVGHVFSSAWAVLAPNFQKFLAITFITTLPNLFLLLRPAGTPGIGWRLPTAVGLGLVLSSITQAVVLYGAFQQLRARPFELGEALRKGLARFFPILGIAILVTLGGAIGFLLLIVPGCMLLVMWSAAVPACVLEGLGPLASLRRSAQLTKGNRWKIFGVLLLLLILNQVGVRGLGLIMALAGHWVSVGTNLIWSAAWGVFWNCVLVMIYHDLRTAKEGVNIDQIASMFD